MIIKCEEAIPLHECVESAMERLTNIWDRIGIAGDVRTSRRGVVQLHLSNLLEEMVKEEDALKDKLIENVEKFTIEIQHLSVELGIPVYKVPESMAVLQAEKDLRQKVELLHKEKQDRMKKLKALIKVDEELSMELATLPYHILSIAVPSLQELKDFEQHIEEMEKEKRRRQAIFRDVHADILSLLDRLELSPNTSFERLIVCESDSVTMNLDNLQGAQKYKEELKQLLDENGDVIESTMERVEQLYKRLELADDERSVMFKKEVQSSGKMSHRIILVLTEELARLEKLKMQNIKKFIIESRKELLHIWDRCYICEEDRRKFTAFYTDDLTEELLASHEDELRRMNDYYNNNKEMLSLVARRQLLWQEFLELERKANNPDRYSNRGGNLLKEEKQRKKVAVDLPKVEQEVKMLIESWERENDRKFLVGGVAFEEFIRREKENYLAEKENEKIIRHQQKVRQMEEEVMFGSRPATPCNKRFANNTNMTPSKTPNKTRKLDTPVSTSKLGLIFKKPQPSPHTMTMKLRQRTNSRLNLQSHLPPHNSKTSSTTSSSSTTTLERAISCQTLNNINNNNVNCNNNNNVNSNNTNSNSNKLVRNACGGSLAGCPGGISTTVLASSSDPDSTLVSICPVGHYAEFANNLNKVSKTNSRSTIIPKRQNLIG